MTVFLKSKRSRQASCAEESLTFPPPAASGNLEFVSAVSRSVRGHVILPLADALREAEELLSQFEVLYPNEAIVRQAVRGCAAYQMNWFDAHIWAYAEHYNISAVFSEDFQHGRLYGSVRAVNPFAG